MEQRKELIKHISRLEGQLASVKRELQKEAPDCEKASNTLCAASRSFASFRRAFLNCFLDTYTDLPKVKGKHKATIDSLMRVVVG